MLSPVLALQSIQDVRRAQSNSDGGEGLELGEGRSNMGLQKDREEKKNMWSLWLLSHNDDVGWDCGIEVCHYDVERLENLLASIWNTSAVEGSYTQQNHSKIQLFKAVTAFFKYSSAEDLW